MRNCLGNVMEHKKVRYEKKQNLMYCETVFFMQEQKDRKSD